MDYLVVLGPRSSVISRNVTASIVHSAGFSCRIGTGRERARLLLVLPQEFECEAKTLTPALPDALVGEAIAMPKEAG